MSSHRCVNRLILEWFLPFEIVLLFVEKILKPDYYTMYGIDEWGTVRVGGCYFPFFIVINEFRWRCLLTERIITGSIELFPYQETEGIRVDWWWNEQNEQSNDNARTKERSTWNFQSSEDFIMIL